MRNKFQKTAAVLRRKIESGEFPAGSRLPCETGLALRMGVSKLTLRRALAELRGAGFIRQVPYVGTFAALPERKRIRIAMRATFPPELQEEMLAAVRSAMGGTEIEMVPAAPDIEDFSSFDLIGVASGSWVPFTGVCRPFPGNMFEEKDRAAFFREPFASHSAGDELWAMPIFFSPVLLMARREAVPEIPKSWEELESLAAFCLKKRKKLWNHYTVERIVAGLLFHASPRSCDIDTESFFRFCRTFPCLFASEIISDTPGDFIAPNNLVNWCCRQYLALPGMQEAWRVFDLPQDPRFPVRHQIAGEYFLLGASCAFPEEAARAARVFLSEKVQRLVARNHLGFPVLKSAAKRAMDGFIESDPLFAGARKELLTNRAAEQEFYLRLGAAVSNLASGGMSLNAFLRFIDFETRIAKLKKLGPINQMEVKRS